MQAHPFPAERILAVALAILAVVVPFLLETLGVLPASYRFVDGAFVVLPQQNDHQKVPTLVFLMATTIGLVVFPSYVISRVRENLTDAERRLQLYAWHLRRLMPE
jgi:serine/threonine-protein kinase